VRIKPDKTLDVKCDRCGKMLSSGDWKKTWLNYFVSFGFNLLVKKEGYYTDLCLDCGKELENRVKKLVESIMEFAPSDDSGNVHANSDAL